MKHLTPCFKELWVACWEAVHLYTLPPNSSIDPLLKPPTFLPLFSEMRRSDFTIGFCFPNVNVAILVLFSISFVFTYGYNHVNIKCIIGHLKDTESTASYLEACDIFVREGCAVYLNLAQIMCGSQLNQINVMCDL